jgi:hypothetical protein
VGGQRVGMTVVRAGRSGAGRLALGAPAWGYALGGRSARCGSALVYEATTVAMASP